MPPDEPVNEPASRPGDEAASAETTALRYRIESLEQQRTAERTSPRWGTPIAASGAALLTGGLGMAWSVPVASGDAPNEFYNDHWFSGWTAVLGALGDVGGDSRVSVAMLSVLSVPVAAVLGFAMAIGQSRRVATFAVAFGSLAWLVGFVLMLLMVGNATKPEADPGGGLFTAMVGAGLIVAAGVRRRRELAD